MWSIRRGRGFSPLKNELIFPDVNVLDNYYSTGNKGIFGYLYNILQRKGQMSVNIKLPDGLQISEFELSMLLASKLFESGLISSGQGAEMVGLSKSSFIEMLEKYEVSVFGYDFDELEEELDEI